MADDQKKGLGIVEAASMVVIALFAVVVIFWIFGWLAGMVWWAVKTAALIAILFFVLRWAYRRSTR
jgi:hypothetical protein